MEAKEVRGVAWREDDFEEIRFNPWTLSGSTNTSLRESEYRLAFPQVVPDKICVGPDGRIIQIEAQLHRSPSQGWVVLLEPGSDWLHSKNFIYFQPTVRPDTGVALCRAEIDDLSQESVSGSYADLQRGDEYPNAAAHPLTRSTYEQLAAVPDPYRQAILLVLHEFVISLSKTETVGLPSLRLTALDDLSYLLEWTFKDRRLGFSFEAEQKESGWYYVYSSDSSQRYESGTMDQLEMNRLIEMILKP